MTEFNTDWDPYQELMIAKHNINELIKALNTQSELFKDLTYQHNNLISVCKDCQSRVQKLEIEVARLKLQML
jgi:hypothetical protein